MQISKPILVTGAAGFVGFHLSKLLLDQGHSVVGIDNLNDYYDVQLKLDRLAQLDDEADFSFSKVDLANAGELKELFEQHQFPRVVNMAAQAGVRYSIDHPEAYINSNLVGFCNLLECCRHHGCGHLVYASSSSVYGSNKQQPFSVDHSVDHPVSLYAATKKSNELMAHTYSHLYSLPTTGLRFFTVYGPWGRPDMALYLFTKAIFDGSPIKVFNHGKMKRDFTYVQDVVEAVARLIDHVPQADSEFDSSNPSPASGNCPYRVYNVGNTSPVELAEFIEILEAEIGREAIKEYLPLQPGDVLETYADMSALQEAIGFQPATSIRDGIRNFVQWYRAYHLTV